MPAPAESRVAGNVLALTRYGPNGASSRVRFLQYLPFLQQQSGPIVTPRPFFSTDYVERLYAGQRPNLADVARSYFRRLSTLVSAGSWDTCWIEKEALPFLPARLERFLERSFARVVIDLDDAVFLNYQQSRRRWVKTILGEKFRDLFRAADVVCAGNRFLANYAETCGARSVVHLPSVVDVSRYSPGPGTRSQPPVIGWIGSPATEHYLKLVAPVLNALRDNGDCRLLLVGVQMPGFSELRAENRVWSEMNEVSDIQAFDVGIMPLADTPWEQGKCGYKLIQYMACGIPVVASAIGANREIVSHGVDGFLATTHAEWSGYLKQLLENPDLRREMGLRGREKVERKYSVQARLPELIRILRH